MIGLTTHVEKIFSHLGRLHRTAVTNGRRAGIPKSTIVKIIEDVNLDLPSELSDLYSIADGTEYVPHQALDDFHFFPGFYWLDIDSSLKIRDEMIGAAAWSATWVPLFANGGGDFYVVGCDDTRPEFGRVIGYMMGEEEQFAEYSGILAFIRTLETCYARGVFYEKGGYLEADFKKMLEIGREIDADFSPFPVTGPCA